MKKKLRLFVWQGFSPDYTDGLAFAIASDETEARKMIVEDMGYDVNQWGELSVLPLDKPAAFSVSGGG